MISTYFNSIKQNKITIALIFIIVMLSTFIYQKLKPNVYQIDFVVKNTMSDLNNDEIKKLISGASAFFSSPNFNSDITIKAMEKNTNVTSVKVSMIKEDENALQISITANSSDALKDMNQWVVNYLNNLDFVKKQIDYQKLYYQTVLTSLQTTLSEIDSNKKIAISTTNNQILYSPLEYVKLKEKLFTMDYKYNQLQGFQLLNNPSVPSSPLGKNMKGYLLLALIFSCILSVGYISIKINL